MKSIQFNYAYEKFSGELVLFSGINVDGPAMDVQCRQMFQWVHALFFGHGRVKQAEQFHVLPVPHLPE